MIAAPNQDMLFSASQCHGSRGARADLIYAIARFCVHYKLRNKIGIVITSTYVPNNSTTV